MPIYDVSFDNRLEADDVADAARQMLGTMRDLDFLPGLRITEVGGEGLTTFIDTTEFESNGDTDVYLIEISDDDSVERFVFSDPAWAAWIDSREPDLADRGHVALTPENVPAGLWEAALQNPDSEDDYPMPMPLTTGSYRDDKIHCVAAGSRSVSMDDLKSLNVVGEFTTMYY